MGRNGSNLQISAGPWHCIGTGFDMTETQLILSMLLSRFTAQPAWPIPPEGAAPRMTLLALCLCSLHRVEATNQLGAADYSATLVS